ncbi:MAG: aminotransferase class V-fold PLP-dependent enzyme [Bacteroidota bacterium]|nr:aminotransferase class V-fold PLP-dependent enzyme [Bacteroidota bacterium]MDQ6904660.1 aminotransferase class V-fold PLP-dependent enzyme [Bacteroidota bacterium]
MPHNHLQSQFLLNPDITYLNFGSFGACPKPIFEDYQKWQLEIEKEPVQFLTVSGPGYLKKSREALAKYIHCNADDVVYVTNPSYGINIIAKSLQLNAGDEILSTSLEYGALDRTWNYYCKKAGAKYVRQEISLPLVYKEQFIKDFFKDLTGNTKAIFISHITSATALIFPVKEICEMAKAKGLFTIVDGAHVPGHIPLDIEELQPDVYTGACHKWMCAPKGCSFLYVKKDWQHLFDPLLISWGYESVKPSDSQFLDYHQLQGTRDYSAFLTIPKTIEFLDEHDWPTVAKDCRQLTHSNYVRFCNLLNTQPLCPVTDEFLGQMCSIPVSTSQPEKLQRLLFDKYRIEVPVMKQGYLTFIRYSIQVFNSQEDLDKLYLALTEIIAEGGLIIA